MIHENEKRTETGAAEGLLFPPEDLIFSVFDLTQELERRGVIEIYQLVSGADAYRIVEEEKRPVFPKQLRAKLAQRIGDIFKRRHSTLWSVDEIKAFKAIPVFDDGDLSVVEEYYRNEAAKENSYCRTSLLTFLRHYPGEVDRARRWKENSRKRHCY